MEDQFLHFVDSHHGIYSAQVFAQSLNFSQVEGIDKDDWNILLQGPDNENYIEVWADCLDSITIIGKDGIRYNVWENEGIYLYPENANIDWESLNY